LTEPSRIEQTLLDLEWPAIVEKAAEFAASSLGAALLREAELAVDLTDVRERLAETTEARELLRRGAEVPLGGLRDVTPVVARLRKAATLDAAELIAMGGMLSVSRRMRNALTRQRDAAPSLAEMAGGLLSLREVERDVEACFGPDGEVADSASAELRQLRRRERGLHQNLLDTVHRLLSASKIKDYLQEELYTVRNGRYVVLVKTEHKGKVDGIVHDLSGSGQSLYIEPREITELNNLLRTTGLEIEQEIRRIFADLTRRIAARVDDVELSLAVLARLDAIFARARYADYLDATEPKVGDRVSLRRLRHPLLVHRGETVVPNDVDLGGDARALVVTGPNAGGKTVTLKAVGLCALMVRAGMHLPVDDGSEMTVFDGIFTDIGDRQSIARSLSSFSGRMLNLKGILEELTARSLVLLDEIGEGTDPAQGQAIAQAALEALHARGAFTIATTHFSGLTALAYRVPGFANASVEFDEDALAPTFRLIPGVPGRSNAIRIARRLGIDAQVAGRADELVAEGAGGLEDVLSRVEEERRRYARDSGRIAELRAEIETSRREQETVLEGLRRQRAKLQEEAAEQVRRDVARARARIREVTERVSAPVAAASPRVVAAAQTELRQVEREARDQVAEASPDLPALEPLGELGTLAPDQEVYVVPVRATGKIVRGPDEQGRVTVQVRGGRLTIGVDKLARRRTTALAAPERPAVFVEIARPEGWTGSRPAAERTCDLRGLYREEALAKVEAGLDAAFRARMPQVVVIHGHGTGVLKAAVREFLAGSGFVKSFRPGEQGEGGDGATVVDLALD
jgi:DNA mismatch repair protein MutS2